MSARNIAIMNAQLAALDAEQESIAQALMTIPHNGYTVSPAYRKAASETNVKKYAELQEKINQPMEVLKTQLLLNVANTKSELQTKLDGVMTSLRKEIDTLTSCDKETNKKLMFLDEDLKTMVKNVHDLGNDVKFVRHEIKSMGSRITTMNHLMTNQNKHLLNRIEALEKDLIVLKTPPPKSEFRWGEFFLIIVLVAIAFAGFFVNKNNIGMLMIEY